MVVDADAGDSSGADSFTSLVPLLWSLTHIYSGATHWTNSTLSDTCFRWSLTLTLALLVVLEVGEGVVSNSLYQGSHLHLFIPHMVALLGEYRDFSSVLFAMSCVRWLHSVFPFALSQGKKIWICHCNVKRFSSQTDASGRSSFRPCWVSLLESCYFFLTGHVILVP